MKITGFLCKEALSANLKSTSKQEVVEELVDLLISANACLVKHKKKILESLMDRELLGSTAIGRGIAIPHAKCDCVDKLIGCLAVSKKGINFDSLDGELAHIFFLLVAPTNSAGPHLKALAKVSRLLKDKFVRHSLKSAENEKVLLKIIQQEDKRLATL